MSEHTLEPQEPQELEPQKSAACKLCRARTVDSLYHAIYSCEANRQAASMMLKCAQCYAGSLTSEGSLRLEVDIQDPFSLPTVTILATGIDHIWSNRQTSVATSEASMRAELQARAELLRQARGRRLREAGAILANI